MSDIPNSSLVATVLAWGAKFSEHPLLVADREAGGGQSRLARMLVNRAREVAEAEKVHRISSVDHVVIALLIEPLQSRESFRLLPYEYTEAAVVKKIPMIRMVCFPPKRLCVVFKHQIHRVPRFLANMRNSTSS